LKIFYGEEVRRIPFPAPKPTWEQFQFILSSIFANNYHPEIRIFYQDEEGDQIIMSSENEWSSAYDFLATQNLPKITLKVPEFPFSQGPPPQPLYFYVQNQNQQQPCQSIPVKSTNDQSLKKMSQDLPSYLEKFFPGGKVLPYNVPDWLRPAVNVRRCQNPAEVDFDLDISKLFQALNDRVISELDQHKTDSARDLLEAELCIYPNNVTSLYNMACCEALAGQKALAIEWLGNAIKYGYDNLYHMMKDSDLDSLRGDPAFERLIQDLRFSQVNAQVTNLKI